MTVIVDYGTGNLNSITRMFARVGTTARVSSDAATISAADRLILPGVGHFGNAMLKLEGLGLVGAINETVFIRRRPVLGICLGMELMAKWSEEGNVSGLGWIDAHAVRFDLSRSNRFKVPHMGWNRLEPKKASALLAGIDKVSEFYFAHSYYLELEKRSDLLSETTYVDTFPSALEADNIYGVQFHPEKSYDAGARLLKNFAEINVSS